MLLACNLQGRQPVKSLRRRLEQLNGRELPWFLLIFTNISCFGIVINNCILSSAFEALIGAYLATDYQSAMASAKVTLGVSSKMQVEETEMVIVGGGICGILAAKQCHDRGMKYVVIEKEAKLGGVWHTMANGTSFLQVRYCVLSS